MRRCPGPRHSQDTHLYGIGGIGSGSGGSGGGCGSGGSPETRALPTVGSATARASTKYRPTPQLTAFRWTIWATPTTGLQYNQHSVSSSQKCRHSEPEPVASGASCRAGQGGPEHQLEAKGPTLTSAAHPGAPAHRQTPRLLARAGTVLRPPPLQASRGCSVVQGLHGRGRLAGGGQATAATTGR